MPVEHWEKLYCGNLATRCRLRSKWGLETISHVFTLWVRNDPVRILLHDRVVVKRVPPCRLSRRKAVLVPADFPLPLLVRRRWHRISNGLQAGDGRPTSVFESGLDRLVLRICHRQQLRNLRVTGIRKP